MANETGRVCSVDLSRQPRMEERKALLEHLVRAFQISAFILECNGAYTVFAISLNTTIKQLEAAIGETLEKTKLSLTIVPRTVIIAMEQVDHADPSVIALQEVLQ